MTFGGACGVHTKKGKNEDFKSHFLRARPAKNACAGGS